MHGGEDVLALMRRVADSKAALAQHGVVSPPHEEGASVLSPEQAHALQKIKGELKTVVLELEREMALRFQVEAALQHEREILFPSKHAKVMQLRDTEIRELEAQRDSMGSWLKRGVKEAERSAGDLVLIKSALAQSKSREEESRIVNEDILMAIKYTENEVGEAQGKVAGLQSEYDALLHDLEQQDVRLEDLQVAIERNAHSSSGFTADRVSLKTHARRLELVETAVSCIAASVRRAEHNINKVQGAIYSGNADMIDPIEDDGFDSEEDAGPSSFPPKVAEVIMPLIYRLKESSVVVADQIKSFTADQSRREKERMEDHARSLAAVRASNAKAREECNEQIYSDRIVINEMEQEREELLSFLKEQQEATVNALENLGKSPHRKRTNRGDSPQNTSFSKELDGDDDDNFDVESNYSAFTRRTTKTILPTSGPSAIPRKLSSIEQIYEIINALKEDALTLERSNAKWAEKVGSQEEDYASVKALRNTYRDLESRKTMLSIEIREEEDRNKELKMLILDYSDMYNMQRGPY